MARIIQKCDFCNHPAAYDAKTIYGPWGYLCEEHYQTIGVKTPGMSSVLDDRIKHEKECSCCHQVLPLTEFYKYVDARGVTRFRTECKKCNLARRKAKIEKKG